jgi:hypothetical protein
LNSGLEKLGEVNMGQAETITNFINYSKEHYPADRIILAFFGDGAGWKGACTDKSNNDWLDMHEIEQGISNAGGVDAVFFTGPSKMGALESVYELRECCELYIGSEYLADLADYIDPNLFSMINNHPAISLESLGSYIINSFIEKKQAGARSHMSMTAIKTENIEKLVDVMDQAAEKWLNNISSIRDIVSNNREAVWADTGYCDVLALLKTAADQNAEFSEIYAQAQSALESCLVHYCPSQYRDYETGLNIYMPVNYDNHYHTTELDFAKDTHWPQMLQQLLSNTAKANGFKRENF